MDAERWIHPGNREPQGALPAVEQFETADRKFALAQGSCRRIANAACLAPEAAA
jgi:hypothetical protein